MFIEVSFNVEPDVLIALIGALPTLFFTYVKYKHIKK